MFFSCLEELIFVLKENYASYQVKPERPQPQAQGGYTEDNLTKFANDSIDAFANFMFTQMFKAAAPENVRRLFSHKDQTRLTVDDAYKDFFTDHSWKWTKRHHRCMQSRKSKISPIRNNSKTLQLSDLNKGNKTGCNRTSTTGATTDPKDKDTSQISTETTARTPIHQNQMDPGMVNSVSIAKF
jgi:hypothetical protein